MHTEEIERDLRRAKWAAWWDKWDMVVYSAAFIVLGAVMGGAAVAYYERSTRSALTRAHDDELAGFRQMCRGKLDDRDTKVEAATSAAAAAAQSAAMAAMAAQSAKEGTSPPKPPVKRSPPVDLKDAVTRANAQINAQEIPK